MKGVLMVAAAVAGLSASAGTGYYMMEKKSPPVETAAALPADAVGDPQFVPMDPLVLPIVENGIVRENVYLQLSLEVDGKEKAQQVLQQKERLHHALLMALYNGPIADGTPPRLNPLKAKALALETARTAKGGEAIKAVRIEGAMPGAQ
jgi:hypothetical protein